MMAHSIISNLEVVGMSSIALETIIRGDGYGTVWIFMYAKGSFEVEFRNDPDKHFVCSEYPTHSHWSIDGDNLFIDFCQYGEFEMKLDSATGFLVGNKKGFKDNWRKCEIVRNLTASEASVVRENEHCCHSKKHSSDCDHKH